MIDFKKLKLDIDLIKGYENIIRFFEEYKDTFMDKNKVISFDIETKDLSMRGNELLGFGIGFSKTFSRYISVRDLSYEQKRNIFKNFNKFKCKIVLHNAYFDISQLSYMFKMDINWNYCTYIMAHSLHTDMLLYAEKKDKKKSLSLKSLCKIYYNELYGYEDELDNYKKELLKIHNIKEKEFTYDLFIDEVLSPYGNCDVLVTYALYEGMKKEISDNIANGWEKLSLLLNIKHNVTKVYIKAKVNGVRVDRDKILELNDKWCKITNEKLEEILKDKKIKDTESLLYMKKYKNLIEKRQKDYDSKLKERLENIKIGKYTQKKLDKAKENIHNLTQKMLDKLEEGSKFNLNSSEHKKILFFELMGLKPLKYNKADKNGNKSEKADKEFLEYYSDIPIVDMIRVYSLYTKGITGFLGVNDVNKEKGFWNNTYDDYPINHPNSNLQGTITHRIAQNNVNLQQIASRGELSELKSCIIPLKDNHRLVTLDYSSCELYILGALSKEQNFVNGILNNLDLHGNMAYMVWGDSFIIDYDKENKIKELLNLSELKYIDKNRTLKSLDLPIKDKLKIIKEESICGNMRYNAKSINFGLPYGIGAKGLANNMKTTIKEAKKLYNQYMEVNHNIQIYMDRNKDLLCERGFIEGEHGQRLYLHMCKGVNWREVNEKYEMTDNDFKILSELRKSTNYIIQSENAFVLYEALIRFDKKIQELGLEDKVFLMTTIYDAVYLSVDKSITDDYIEKLLREVFETNYKDNINFRIDFGSGENMKKLGG